MADQSPNGERKVLGTIKEVRKKITQAVDVGFEKFDNTVSKFRVRRILLIFILILTIIGTIATLGGTYSAAYHLKRVNFSNETFYQKALEYGPLYQPLNVSLVPDHPQRYTVSAYEFTPTGRPAGYKFPTIIWCHGMVANAEMQLHYAQEMAHAGFKVIAIHLDGHGDSGGLWSIGLTNIQTVYAAVEYAAGLPDVDNTSICVTGHSNGGYAVARAALFDKTPLGTGGLIRAVGSMWTVSDFNRTLQELVGWGNPIGDPSYSWLIPMFVGQSAPYFTNEDTLRRSISDYVNGTNIPNWFIITGSKDQMGSDGIHYDAMAAAVEYTVTADEIRATVESQWNDDYYGEWSNLDSPTITFSNGTARKIAVLKNVDHLVEAMDPTMVQKTVEWFRLALGLSSEEYQTRMEAGVPVRVFWFARLGGWFFLLAATLLGMIYLTVVLAPILFPERFQRKIKISLEQYLAEHPEMEYDGFLPPGLDEFLTTVEEKRPRELAQQFALTFRKKLRFFIGLTLCIAGGVALFFLLDPPPFMRIWIFNAYIWQFLLSGALMWGYALWVLYKYKKSKYYGPNVSLKRVGGTWDGLGKGFLYAVLTVFIPVMLHNILCQILMLPKLFPRPFATGIWIDVFLGGAIIWFLYLPFEVMIKTQLFAMRRDYSTKSGYWLEIITNAIFVFFIWAVGYIVGALFMGRTLLGMIFLGTGFGGQLFITINALMFLINGLMTIYTGVIFQRSRNVFACSLFATCLWVIILFGKAFGIYAVF
jgi:pimeloyl-ACP methyl ester carboxylesterase